MNMKCSVVLVFVILSFIVNGNGQHLICRREQTASSQASTRTKQGIQRKRGAPGIKGNKGETGRKGESGPTGTQGIRGEQGEIGPQGPPAIVDYSRIEAEVLERSIAALKTKINNISATMFKMDERITAHQKQTLCDVFYNGKCFHAIIHLSNFHEAQSLCENIGWKLANIYDLSHQDMIEEYLREKEPSENFWLGMTYDSQTRRVTDTDGNIVNSAQIKWHSGNPNSDTNIVIETHRSSDSNEGLKTVPQSYNCIGALCEM